MPELIDRYALLKDIKSDCPESDVCVAETSCIECIIGRQPTIEAEPVRHGRWIMLEPYGAHHTRRRKCSECGEIKAKELTNFCPNCGSYNRYGGADNG